MDLTAILGFLIGLVTIYAVLAMMASALQEVLAGVFSWRGKYLTRAIELMLDGQAGATLASSGLPAWIGAHFRAPAASGAAGTPSAAGILEHPLVPGSAASPPSYLSSRSFAAALLDLLGRGSQAASVQGIEATVAQLPEGTLKTTMQAIIADAGHDLDAVRARIEAWFDETMDRLSGAYRRFSQYALLAIGLCLAVAFNVDSFRVATTLWQVPSVRAAMLDAATAASAGPTGLQNAQEAMARFEAANLPIGWAAPPSSPATALVQAGPALAVLPGWIVTALAVSLGAPFWFSLLQSLLSLRNAGPKPGQSANS